MKIPSFFSNLLYILVALASLCGIITSVYHNTRLAIDSSKAEIKIKNHLVDLNYQYLLLQSEIQGLEQKISLVASKDSLADAKVENAIPVNHELSPESEMYQVIQELNARESQAAEVKTKILQSEKLLNESPSEYNFLVVTIEMFSLFSYVIIYSILRSSDFKMRY